MRLNDCAAAILVGGESRRMGQPKALLRLGSESLVRHLVHLMQPAFGELLLVGNLDLQAEVFAGSPAQLVRDLSDQRSSLNGVASAISQSSSQWTALFACDAPEPCIPLLSFMCQRACDEVDVVCCADELGIPQPFHAIWSKSALPFLEAALSRGELALHHTLAQLRLSVMGPNEWKVFDPQGRFLLNLNTPEQLEHYKQKKA